MKSYCVKEKKQTECVKGSEKQVKAKNGRLMMKCKCASCGISKTQFVKSNRGRGVRETINKAIGSQLPGFQQAQDFYELVSGDKKTLKDYWSGKIAKDAFNKKDGFFTKNFWDRDYNRRKVQELFSKKK